LRGTGVRAPLHSQSPQSVAACTTHAPLSRSLARLSAPRAQARIASVPSFRAYVKGASVDSMSFSGANKQAFDAMVAALQQAKV